MHIANLSKGKFSDVAIWAIIASTIFIIVFSLLGRASLNLKGAVINKPDLAIYILLPEEEITKIEVLRELDQERDYLITTKEEGLKFVKLQKIDGKWTLATLENMKE